MKKIPVKIKRKDTAKDLPIPAYATPGSSGVDLYADVEEDVVLKPHDIKLVSCGIYIELPVGYEAQIRPRSGFNFDENKEWKSPRLKSNVKPLVKLIIEDEKISKEQQSILEEILDNDDFRKYIEFKEGYEFIESILDQI